MHHHELLQGIGCQPRGVLRCEGAAQVVESIQSASRRALVLVRTGLLDLGEPLQAVEFLVQRHLVAVPGEYHGVECSEPAKVLDDDRVQLDPLVALALIGAPTRIMSPGCND